MPARFAVSRVCLVLGLSLSSLAFAPGALAILPRAVVFEETWEDGLAGWTARGDLTYVDCGRGRPGCSLSVTAQGSSDPYVHRALPDIPVPVGGKLRISTYMYPSTPNGQYGNVAEFYVNYNIGGVLGRYAGFGYTSDGIWYHGTSLQTLYPVVNVPIVHGAAPERWYELVLVFDAATITWEVRNDGGGLLWSHVEPILAGPDASDPLAPLGGGAVTIGRAAFASYRYHTLWFDTLRFEAEGYSPPPINGFDPGEPIVVQGLDLTTGPLPNVAGINCLRVKTGPVVVDAARLVGGDLFGWINPGTPIQPYTRCG